MVRFYLQKTRNTETILNQLRTLNFKFEMLSDGELISCKGENCSALIKHEVWPTQNIKMIIWNEEDKEAQIYLEEIWSVYEL